MDGGSVGRAVAILKRLRGLWIAFALVMLGGLALAGFFLSRSPGNLPRMSPGLRDAFTPGEMSLLQDGDVVLRRGSSTASDLIVLFLQDGLGLSHCGMLLAASGKSAGSWQVLHCINGSFGGKDGVQLQDLSAFNANSLPDSLVVVRPLVDTAHFRRILAAAQGLGQAAIPFDNSFDLTDRHSMYCTELLAEIFEQAGWWPPPLSGTSPRYRLSGIMLDFRTFLDPRFFRVIISHNPAIPAD